MAHAHTGREVYTCSCCSTNTQRPAVQNTPFIVRDGRVLQEVLHGGEQPLLPGLQQVLKPALHRAVSRVQHHLEEGQDLADDLIVRVRQQRHHLQPTEQ